MTPILQTIPKNDPPGSGKQSKRGGTVAAKDGALNGPFAFGIETVAAVPTGASFEIAISAAGAWEGKFEGLPGAGVHARVRADRPGGLVHDVYGDRGTARY